MAAALLSLFRSLFAREVGNPVPTMHSLRSGQRGCPPRDRCVRVVHARGRLVISGRMADVCAELDRLAAIESASPT